MLERLWPDEGTRFVVALRKGRPPLQVPVGSVEEARVVAEQFDAADRDVYFALSSFAGDTRKAAEARFVRSFWIDLDAGEGKPYATWQDALRALVAWREAQHFLSPTVIVRSGAGLHVYWCLARPVTPEQWLPVADRFKRALAVTGLAADPARTADLASILRFPGTRNFKTDPPLPVVVLADDGPVHAFEDFSLALPQVGPVGVVPARKGEPDEFDVTYNHPPANVEAIEAKCGQLRAVKAVGGAVAEPLWRAALSVITRCERGEDLIHEWSRGDERYDAGETARKAAGTVGPATCAHFSSLNPAGCEGCPFAGKIKSPINLGTPVPPPLVREEDAPDELRLNEIGPFKVTAKGVYYDPPAEDGIPQPAQRLSYCPLWVLEVREKARAPGEPDESRLWLAWHSIDGASKRAELPQASVYDRRAFTKWLGDYNLISQILDLKGLTAYISMYTRELMQRRAVRKYYDTLGWHGDEFVVGRKAIGRDYVHPAVVTMSSPAADLAPAPDGTLEGWTASVACLGEPRLWCSAFALLAAFASPLVSLTGVKCAVLSLAGITNAGKTLTASTALSVYGSPALIMQAASSTPVAVDLQMGLIKDIPHVLDEMTRMPPAQVGAFLYAAADGRPKMRGQKDGELRQARGWSLVPIVTSNQAILDFASNEINSAHRARVLEFNLPLELGRPTVVNLVAATERHYGTAAVPYIQAVIAQKGAIKKAFLDVDAWLTAKGVPDRFRYGRWLVALAMVGGTIAYRRGIITWDPAPVIERTVEHMLQVAEKTPAEESLFVQVLAEMVSFRIAQVCTWSSAKGAFATFVPAREPIARHDEGKNQIYILASALDAELQKHALSVGHVKPWMQKVKAMKKPMRLVPSAPPVLCYCFDLAAVGLTMDRKEETEG